jgi:hypothetical protein
MPKLPNLHLHRLLIDDTALPLVVKARSLTAARDHFIEHHLKVERLTPEEAFNAGVVGAAYETAGATADATDAATPDRSSEPGLFDSPSNGAPPSTTGESDADSRPIDGNGPGYAAALSEAATL